MWAQVKYFLTLRLWVKYSYFYLQRICLESVPRTCGGFQRSVAAVDVPTVGNGETQLQSPALEFTASGFHRVSHGLTYCSANIGYCSGVARGEQGERPPPRNPENLQRMGNNPGLNQQWESIVVENYNFR